VKTDEPNNEIPKDLTRDKPGMVHEHNRSSPTGVKIWAYTAWTIKKQLAMKYKTTTLVYDILCRKR